MMVSTTPHLTGGCQCGAVRFAISVPPVRIGLCHCRMCQKAIGGPFLSVADFRHNDFAWTRGKPSTFQSSSIAERDFCATCGTPLTYRLIGGEYIEVTTGSFDRPDLVPPTYASGTESKLSWVDGIANMPGRTTTETQAKYDIGQIVSHQHPDRE